VDPDRLLDEMDDETFRASDERMPYFAALWAAGEALAGRLLAGPPLGGRRVLDLGCGLGVVGIAAAFRGGRVTFIDWEPRALEFVSRSLAAQGLTAEALVPADWRSPPPLAPFDLVLAADVLYEERNLPGILSFSARHLAPGGEAWIADPGRRHAEGLAEKAREAGLAVLGSESLGTGPKGGEIRLTRLAG
jgi:predicted nicotinamide N-methyase